MVKTDQQKIEVEKNVLFAQFYYFMDESIWSNLTNFQQKCLIYLIYH